MVYSIHLHNKMLLKILHPSNKLRMASGMGGPQPHPAHLQKQVKGNKPCWLQESVSIYSPDKRWPSVSPRTWIDQSRKRATKRMKSLFTNVAPYKQPLQQTCKCGRRQATPTTIPTTPMPKMQTKISARYRNLNENCVHSYLSVQKKTDNCDNFFSGGTAYCFNQSLADSGLH